MNLILLLLSFSFGYGVFWLYFQLKRGGFQALGDEILHRAEIEAEERLSKLEIALKERSLNFHHQLELKEKNTLNKLEALEKKLQEREARIDRQEQALQEERSRLSRVQKNVVEKQNVLTTLKENLAKKSEALLGPEEQVKDKIYQQLVLDVKNEKQQLLSELVTSETRFFEKQSSQLLVSAMQRVASPAIVDLLTLTVELPSSEMKRRLIGREGKNIRLLERMTGANFLLDETPHAVVISSFDPIRREIAKNSIQQLLKDGRIHPSRIEEIVLRQEQQIDTEMIKRAEDALRRFQIHPTMSNELLHALGKLYFHFDEGQNVYAHSIEVATIMRGLAHELSLDAKLATRIGLLHDIGKALPLDSDGCHAEVGARFALNHGETGPVCNGIHAHHFKISPNTFEAALCPIANMLSSNRLGARNRGADPFIRRLRTYENFAQQMEGVEQAFVLEAGKELRVIVNAKELNEYQTHTLAKQLARKIEEESTFRGKIKVTVLRESRFVEFAK